MERTQGMGRRVETLVEATRIPRPNSALSSNSEFDQAGPRPSAFLAQGVVGRLPP